MANRQHIGKDALSVYADVIIEHVKPSQLFKFLGTYLMDHFVEIIAVENTGGPQKAMALTLQTLIDMNKPGIYPLFLEALKETEYEMVWRVLAGYTDVKDQTVYKEMLKVMLPKLSDIDPADILTELRSKGCLSTEDIEEIMAACSQKGKSWGVLLLFCSVTKKREDWFPVLMWAMLNNGCSHRVKEIEVKFAEAETYEDMKALCEKWREQKKADREESDELSSEFASLRMTHSEMGSGTEVMAGNRAASIEDNATGGDIAARPRVIPAAVDVTIPVRQVDDVTVRDAVSAQITPTAQTYTRDDLYSYKDRDVNPLPKYILNQIDALGIANTKTTSFAPVDTVNAPQPVQLPPRRRLVDLSEMVPHDTSDVNKDPQPLNLRSYQEELAQDAMRDENCLIVAPTGSGKTHVAMAIAKNHFEVKKEEEAKVVFVVPTTALVEQQKSQFETYLSQRVVGLSGESQIGGGMSMENLLDAHDIFVLTPQILIDALNRGLETIAVFSLLIFDECHHCMKEHPYNVIMGYYDEERVSGSAVVPQIVGLTASVGVGKARTQLQAENHILKLCANLDSKICTVVDHKETLERHVNNPQEEKLEVRGRVNDPFSDNMNTMMRRIEGMMVEETEQHPRKTMEEIQAKMKPPKGRSEQSYTQWIAELEKEIARLHDQSSRRILHSCLVYLKTYHNALIINSDCRTKDAVDYITKELAVRKQKQSQNYFDDTDDTLLHLYMEEEGRLDLMAKDHQVGNPKLQKLKDVILQKYNKEPDSRAILFCKTRELTVALESWINDDDDLKHLKPKKLVGSNAPASRQGMTQKEQNELILSFRDGTHKIIIATTVAEEGLDISKCNLVLRYEHVTNETARIQAKGRARADEANYVLVGERGKGAISKERLNTIREDMMHRALDSITTMDPRAFTRRIRDLQMESRKDREMKRTAKRLKETMRVRRNPFQLRCRKCDSFICQSTDIRLIQDMHHVCVDPEFYRQVHVHVFDGKFKEFDANGEFMRAGKLTCGECGEDWGMQAIYKSFPVPVIAAVSFVAVATSGTAETRDTYKKWKEVPFAVEPMTREDLENVCKSAERMLSPENKARLFNDDMRMN